MPNVKLTPEVRKQVLAAVQAGTHPQTACTASGLGPQYMKHLRAEVRRGVNVDGRAFLDDIARAAALAETGDVLATKRAASVESLELSCPHCHKEFKGDPVHLANVIGAAESGQRIKASAAGVAMQRLERRFPQRWSQKVVHTVQEEHERLLDVCERILTPEVFEALLDEYFASDGGESETAEAPGEPPSDAQH